MMGYLMDDRPFYLFDDLLAGPANLKYRHPEYGYSVGHTERLEYAPAG